MSRKFNYLMYFIEIALNFMSEKSDLSRPRHFKNIIISPNNSH